MFGWRPWDMRDLTEAEVAAAVKYIEDLNRGQ